MRIVWPNVFAALLAICTLVLVLKTPCLVSATVAAIGHIGQGHTPEDRTLGLVVLGLILVTIVAIVRILANGRDS